MILRLTELLIVSLLQEGEVPGGGDGSRNGRGLFQCSDKHGLFLPVAMIKKDPRFSDGGDNSLPDQNTRPTQSNSSAASNVITDQSGSSSDLLKQFLFQNPG